MAGSRGARRPRSPARGRPLSSPCSGAAAGAGGGSRGVVVVAESRLASRSRRLGAASSLAPSARASRAAGRRRCRRTTTCSRARRARRTHRCASGGGRRSARRCRRRARPPPEPGRRPCCGIAAHGALDAPREAGVLKDSLGEDVGLPAHVRDDKDVRLRGLGRRRSRRLRRLPGPSAASVQLAAASSQITMSAIRRGASMASRAAMTSQSAAAGRRSSPYRYEAV